MPKEPVWIGPNGLEGVSPFSSVRRSLYLTRTTCAQRSMSRDLLYRYCVASRVFNLAQAPGKITIHGPYGIDDRNPLWMNVSRSHYCKVVVLPLLFKDLRLASPDPAYKDSPKIPTRLLCIRYR